MLRPVPCAAFGDGAARPAPEAGATFLDEFTSLLITQAPTVGGTLATAAHRAGSRRPGFPLSVAQDQAATIMPRRDMMAS